MLSLNKGVLLLSLLGIMLPGCGRQLDLLKIVGKNFVYEIRHTVQPPAAKLNPFRRGNPGTHVGWIGHSTILMSFSGFFILTDPNFSNRIKIARRVVGLPIEPEEIRELDLILISHAHYDHLDLASLKRLPKQSLLVVPEGCRVLVDGLGFLRVVEMKWNDVLPFQGLTIEAIQPSHWGKRSPFDDEDRGYNSYLLSANGKRILFAGDTGYSRAFEEKGKERTIDLAFLPISAYKPAWFRRNHVSPEEALKMFIESGAKFMIPIHWGTFILSHEPITEPPERLKIEAKRLGIENRVVLLRQGESFTLPE
jgi:L-ascorbate metabolism protein UlaG (beta-lactamase superfamily)